jgi:hypothetical protein
LDIQGTTVSLESIEIFFEGVLPADRVCLFCALGGPPKPFPWPIMMHPKGRWTMKWSILKSLPVR